MSSEKRWMMFQAFERLVPPLKDDAVEEWSGDRAQGLGHPVVLLDDRGTGSARLADGGQKVGEVVPLVEHQRAPQVRAVGNTDRAPKS